MIIQSLLDTDLYKFTMMQVVLHHFPAAQAEYRFDNRLSAQAQWDNAYSDIPIGNLGIDLKLRWEVE